MPLSLKRTVALTPPTVPTPTQRQGSGPSIPVRLFIVAADDAGLEGAVWERAAATSRPVEALQPDGAPTTLAHALHRAAPALFPEPPPTTAPAAAAAAAGRGGSEGGAAASEAPARGGAGGAAAAARGAAERADVGDLGPLGSQEGTAAGEEAAGDGQQQPGPAEEEAAGTSGGAAVASTAAADGDGSAEEAARPQGSGGSSTTTQAAAALQAALTAAKRGPHPGAAAVEAWAKRQASKCRVVAAGVELQLHAPLAWLHAQLHAADLFLYLCVHMKQQ